MIVRALLSEGVRSVRVSVECVVGVGVCCRGSEVGVGVCVGDVLWD